MYPTCGATDDLHFDHILPYSKPFGTVIAHVGFVVILAGFVVSATTGFKDDTFIAPVGVPSRWATAPAWW